MKTFTLAVLICVLVIVTACHKQQATAPPVPDNSAEIAALRKQVDELSRQLKAAKIVSVTPTPKAVSLPTRESRLAAAQQRASRALLMAPREDQLKAALSAKLLQERGGLPMTADEFQFLSQDLRRVILVYVPALLPVELLP